MTKTYTLDTRKNIGCANLLNAYIKAVIGHNPPTMSRMTQKGSVKKVTLPAIFRKIGGWKFDEGQAYVA